MKLVTDAMKNAWHTFVWELKNNWRHLRGARQARRIRGCNEMKLHLGCGKNYLEGWINVDVRHKADLWLGLREPFPLQDNSASSIFSEHFLEHVNYPDEANHVLSECYRVLQTGGKLRIGVPDSETPIRAYLEGHEAEYFKRAKERWHPAWVRLPMEHVNYHFRDSFAEHKWAYDEETLNALFQRNGFLNVERAAFDPETDAERRNINTLYVQGYK